MTRTHNKVGSTLYLHYSTFTFPVHNSITQNKIKRAVIIIIIALPTRSTNMRRHQFLSILVGSGYEMEQTHVLFLYPSFLLSKIAWTVENFVCLSPILFPLKGFRELSVNNFDFLFNYVHLFSLTPRGRVM